VAKWRAAGRRFAILLGSLSAAIVVISLPLGLLVGSSVDRAISLGFYLVGAFLAFSGFFLGNRGPVRPVGEDRGWRVGRGLRGASPDEHREALVTGGLLAVLGFVLLAIGVAVDSRYRLI
jgi:hypothetical protein